MLRQHRLSIFRRATVASIATVLVATLGSGLSPATEAAPAEATAAEAVPLTNPSFEEVDGTMPVGWHLDPPPRAQTASASTDYAHTGERSLRIDDPLEAIAVRSDPVAAFAGATYTASAWLYSESGSPAWLYLEFFDHAGARISERHIEPAATAGWQQISVTGTAPAGTVAIDLLVYGSGSRSGVSYVDDVAVAVEGLPLPYDPQVGSERQLFHDDYRIASTERVSRLVHPAEKLDGPVIVPDKPWESNNVYVYGTALYDEDARVFKLWYHAYNREHAQYLTLYATSRDGERWHKPELDIYEFEGSTANNIVGDMHSPTVIKDDRDPDPARRYKMMAMDYAQGYVVYFSPDGINWTAYEGNPVMANGDVSNVFYDDISERFVATSKHPHPSGRAVFISYSDDFETWTEPKVILYADERDQNLAVANGRLNAQIYGMPAIPYEGVYVGFPWMFEFSGSGEPGTAGDGPMDVQLAFSRDLETWQRDDRRPVIERGIEGSFDSGMNFTAGNVIVRDDRIWMYYGGWDGLHGSSTRGAAIGLASWRVDGFASLANGGDIPGVVTTKPLVFDGSELHVNADIERGGSLRVEVLDVDGEVMPGFEAAVAKPVTGDSTDRVLTWKNGDLADLTGQEVSLRFHLDDGDLYSYWFAG